MKRIMIVDDSLVFRINLKNVLEKHGYQVVAEAVNGQDAVEKYIKFLPDLTTMDITMPILDGISALKNIMVKDSSACIVMISAMGQESKVIESLNNGARHFIVKPFKEADVINIVAGVLDAEQEEAVNVCTSR